jgi:hypothetical protein
LFVVAAVSSSAQQGVAPRPAAPIEPITAIPDAFGSHAVVALGTGAHGNEQGFAFQLALIRDSRFAATVNDIVIEFGNARYQNVMDRFILTEAVPDEALRQVWQNTTQPQVASAMPEELYRAVRAVNATLTKERQLRVLLGEPPIDWDTIRTADDLRKWREDPLADRDRYAADLIRREVLAKQRRALIVYGDGHVFRVPVDHTIVSLLEGGTATRVFTVGTPLSTPKSADLKTLQADVASWRIPSLAMVRGTVIGATTLDFFYGPWPRSVTLEDQIDALLYLGPPSAITMAPPLPPRCADPAFTERLRRMSLTPIFQGQVDRLKRACAAQAAN